MGVPCHHSLWNRRMQCYGREGCKGKSWILIKGSSIKIVRNRVQRRKMGTQQSGRRKGKTLKWGTNGLCLLQLVQTTHKVVPIQGTLSLRTLFWEIPTHLSFCPREHLRFSISSIGVSRRKVGCPPPLYPISL